MQVMMWKGEFYMNSAWILAPEKVSLFLIGFIVLIIWFLRLNFGVFTWILHELFYRILFVANFSFFLILPSQTKKIRLWWTKLCYRLESCSPICLSPLRLPPMKSHCLWKSKKVIRKVNINHCPWNPSKFPVYIGTVRCFLLIPLWRVVRYAC